MAPVGKLDRVQTDADQWPERGIDVRVIGPAQPVVVNRVAGIERNRVWIRWPGEEQGTENALPLMRFIGNAAPDVGGAARIGERAWSSLRRNFAQADGDNSDRHCYGKGGKQCNTRLVYGRT